MDFATVSTAESVYVIGGSIGQDLTRTIVEFNNGTWRKAGNGLQASNGRASHGAIILGDSLLVLGGYSFYDGQVQQ